MWQIAVWDLHLHRETRRNWFLVAFGDLPAMDKTGAMFLPKQTVLYGGLEDLHVAKIPNFHVAKMQRSCSSFDEQVKSQDQNSVGITANSVPGRASTARLPQFSVTQAKGSCIN